MGGDCDDGDDHVGDVWGDGNASVDAIMGDDDGDDTVGDTIVVMFAMMVVMW